MKDLWRKGLVLLAVLGLAACDAGPSAVMHDGDGKSPASAVAPPVAAFNDDEASMAVPDRAGAQAQSASEADLAARDLAAARDYAPLPLPQGARAVLTATHYGDWPLWSSNRKYSADDNAHYHYEKHGAELGAHAYGDYVAMVHGFIHHPPPGTQSVRRNNGDLLFYNARENVFAVMTSSGAPRTVFRPYDGAAYWQKQKQIESGRRTPTRAAAGDD